MLKEDHESLEGNDKFYGFAVDMMDVISEELDFVYEIYVVPDGNFGVELPTGEWNGMIGEVLSGVSVFHVPHIFITCIIVITLFSLQCYTQCYAVLLQSHAKLQKLLE